MESSISPLSTTPAGLTAIRRSESTVRAGSRDIFVTELVADGGPTRDLPMVLLHGGGPGASGMSNYARNVDAFALDGYRVVVPDMPAYGRSTKELDRSDPFGDLAVFLRSLFDELGIERAHLLGNSLGGAAVLRFALDRPDRVASQVLMGPAGIGMTRGLPTRGTGKLFGYYAGEGPSREKLREFITEYLVFDASGVTEEMLEERYRSSIDPEVLAAPPLRRPSGPTAPRTVMRMDFTRDRRIATCAVPTLVVWGVDDKVNKPSGGPWLARHLPRCDLHMYSRTGHWAQFEQPDRFNRLVCGWLEGVL